MLTKVFVNKKSSKQGLRFVFSSNFTDFKETKSIVQLTLVFSSVGN